MSAKSAAKNIRAPRLLGGVIVAFLAAMQLPWTQAKILVEGPPLPPPASSSDALAPHVADFTDGSQLHGLLTSISENEVILTRSDASGPLSFPVPTVSRLHLPVAPNPEVKPAKTAIQFTTGDWLVADVMLMRDGKAELRLANQQRLSVAQSFVDWISFSENQAPDVYHGPDSMEGWTSNGAWSCQDGVLRCRQMGNIGRNFAVVPDRIDLRFVMDKSEVQKNFMLSFNFARQDGNTSDGSGNAWSQVRLNEGQLYLYAASGNANKNSSITLPRLALKPDENGKFNYRLLFDRIGGKMAIYINGKKVSEQETPKMPMGVWNGSLTFQPMRWGSEADWAISDIHMIPWDGQLPQADGQTTPARLDSLTMTNGEVKTGRLESMQGVVVKFRSAAGTEEILKKDVSMLRLHRPEGAAAPAVATGPKIVLSDRGELKLNAAKLADGAFTLGTTFAGDVPMPLAGVAAMIYPNAAVENVPAADQIVFRNGDVLRGKLIATAHDAPIHWQYGNAAEIKFQTKRVGGVLLRQREEVPLVPGDCVARFRNGDWLGGTMLDLDAKRLQLKSCFGNEFSIPREQMQTLYLAKSGKAPIWEGATDPEAWWMGNQGPNSGMVNQARGPKQGGMSGKAYLDGSFLLPPQTNTGNGIGRTIEDLPDRLEISFEVATAASITAFSAQLFYEKQSNNGLMIQVWQGGLYLYDMAPRKGGRGFGAQPQQVQWGDKIDANAKKHRFQVFADRKSRRALVYMDNVLLAQFARKGAEKDDTAWGNGISINTNNGGGAATLISQLWIAPWNGQTPSTQPQKEAKESVALANGDESVSKILSANSKSVVIDFEGAPLQIPRDKVLLADFGTTPEEKKPELTLAGMTVQPRLRLAKGGTLTVENMKVEGEQLSCSNASFGQLQVPLGAVSEIIWSGLDRDLQQLQSKMPNTKKRVVIKR